MTTTLAPPTTVTHDPPQRGLAHVLAVWAAVTAPMSVAAWVAAPWLAHHLHDRDPFITALLVCFDVAMAWQVVLVLGLVRRERGTLAVREVARALRLVSPTDPATGRRGGRVWWWAVPFTLLSALINWLPIDPVGPLPRDFPHAIETRRVTDYFHHNVSGVALLLVCTFLAPISEELVFRGWLLPRTRALFGRGDIAVNGLMFAAFHLHQPWGIPAAVLDGAFGQAWPSRRYRSTWFGIITHTAPSFLIAAVVIGLAL